jgi:hypothetical protein
MSGRGRTPTHADQDEANPRAVLFPPLRGLPSAIIFARLERESVLESKL